MVRRKIREMVAASRQTFAKPPSECESHLSIAADTQKSSSETSAKTLQQSETRSKGRFAFRGFFMAGYLFGLRRRFFQPSEIQSGNALKLACQRVAVGDADQHRVFQLLHFQQQFPD